MDKVKTNFVIVIAALAILCIVLSGYAVNLNNQLGAEKTRAIELNDQITGFNTKVNSLEAQLTSATTKANDQTNLINSLQSSLNSLRSSLDTANVELEKLKTAYADLESKLKVEVPVNEPQPAVN